MWSRSSLLAHSLWLTAKINPWGFLLNWIYSKVHYINSTERMKAQTLLVTSQLLFGIYRGSLWLSEPEQNLASFEYYSWLVSGPKWSESEPNICQDFHFSVTAIKERMFLAGCSPVCSVTLLPALGWSCSTSRAPTVAELIQTLTQTL